MVPPESSKTIRRPISIKMKSILDTLAMVYGRNGYLIPGSNPHKPMTTHSINRYFSRMWNHLFEKYKMPKFLSHYVCRSTLCITKRKRRGNICNIKMLGLTLAVYNKHNWIKGQAEEYQLSCSLSDTAIKEVQYVFLVLGVNINKCFYGNY